MKVRTSVKPMCDKCKVIKRHGKVMALKNIFNFFVQGEKSWHELLV